MAVAIFIQLDTIGLLRLAQTVRVFFRGNGISKIILYARLTMVPGHIQLDQEAGAAGGWANNNYSFI